MCVYAEARVLHLKQKSTEMDVSQTATVLQGGQERSWACSHAQWETGDLAAAQAGSFHKCGSIGLAAGAP